jgi:hypothetical protein
MKHVQIFFFLTAVLVLFSACRSSSGVVGDADGSPDADSTRVYTNAVHVLVDGRDVGEIPRTVRVRRSFGTRAVSLWQAGEVIRKYEIPIYPTSEGEQTRMGFWGTRSIDGETYDVRNLPNEDETYQVPFSNGPMKIEDREYGVTLLIRE